MFVRLRKSTVPYELKALSWLLLLQFRYSGVQLQLKSQTYVRIQNLTHICPTNTLTHILKTRILICCCANFESSAMFFKSICHAKSSA